MLFLGGQVMYSDSKLFKTVSFIPTLVLSVVGLLLIYCSIRVGHIPSYGIDPDPYSSFSASTLDVFNFILLTSLYLVFLSPFAFLAVAIFKRKKLSKKSFFKWGSLYLLGMILCFVLRQSSAFLWLMD